MVAGALGCGSALLLAAALPNEPDSFHALVSQPAAWCVPLAFLVMITVSLFTRHRAPGRIDAVMARLHVPEALDEPLP
jgi:Na+(H+)/acetate symporter ActP